eukprot:8335935-Heterocapsa_arctica.AAC.1
MEYPPIELALACQAHTAPRILKAEEVVSNIQGGLDTSILAGDIHSNNFARMVLYDMLFEAHNRWGPSAPESYVDDMAQGVIGKPEEVTKLLIDSSTFIVNSLRSKGFKVSVKSTMVPASSKAVQEAVKQLANRGIEVSMASAARDLGIDVTAARQLSTVIASTRFDKARVRA